MRAALVVWVESEQAVLPAIEPARGLLAANWSSPGFSQPLWVAPTRHPRRLRAALTDIPLPVGVAGDPLRDPFAETHLDPDVVGWES
jgi:hypothetical protein